MQLGVRLRGKDQPDSEKVRRRRVTPRERGVPAPGIKDRLPHPHGGRGHFDAFVVGAELQRLLEAQQPRRDQPLQFLTSGLADVGELLLLGDVDVHVV